MVSIEQIKERAQAERVSVHLVLKEHVHLLVLDYLFKQGAFPRLVFQGGTALRLAYRGVRYSEDLDFVLGKRSSPFFGRVPTILKGLPSFLDKAIPFSRRVEVKEQKQTSTFQRFNLILEAESLGAGDRTSIEVANVPSYENQAVFIHSEFASTAPAVCVETPREILSDKLCAFGSREYVKGRDLWDIHFLMKTLHQPIDDPVKRMVRRKTADYRLSRRDFMQRFRAHLSTLEDRGSTILRDEMHRFLPAAHQDLFKGRWGVMEAVVLEALKEFYEAMKKR